MARDSPQCNILQGVLREPATPSSILLAGEIMKLVFSWIIIVRMPHEGTAAQPGLGQFKVRATLMCWQSASRELRYWALCAHFLTPTKSEWFSFLFLIAICLLECVNPQTFTWLMSNSSAMVVPAVVYLVMNLLSYVSLQRIDAGLFTVFAQCKVSKPPARY
jgi:hypothetical protein